MPSTYAHFRFGQQVYHRLPEKLRSQIQPYKNLFDIGLHGPDLLFYYRPLIANRINRIGYAMHNQSGYAVFSRFGKIASQSERPEAYLAYLYGFLCHFALDRECHAYIDEKIIKSGVRHAEIEVEFDRFLLIQDHKNPLTQILTHHIQPSIANSKRISHFFPGVKVLQIQKAMHSMIFYNHLLIAPHTPKRKFIYALLRATGNDKEMHGLVMNRKPNPNCVDSNQKLYQLYHHAEEKAITMIMEYQDTLSGKLPWRDWYFYTFGSQYKGRKRKRQ